MATRLARALGAQHRAVLVHVGDLAAVEHDVAAEASSGPTSGPGPIGARSGPAEGALSGDLHRHDALDADPSTRSAPTLAAGGSAFAVVRPDDQVEHPPAEKRRRAAHLAAAHDADGDRVGAARVEDILEGQVAAVRDERRHDVQENDG